MSFCAQDICSRLLDALSGPHEEKARLKKRRLDFHFSGLHNIKSAAFTIASEPLKDGIVGGYFLKLSGVPPYKPVQQASEGFCLDSVHANRLSPVLFSLCSLFHLGLPDLEVSLHFVSQDVLDEMQALIQKRNPKNVIEEAICFLCDFFPKLEIIPCYKGSFFEKMQSKMYIAKHHNMNELVALDFEVTARFCLGLES